MEYQSGMAAQAKQQAGDLRTSAVGASRASSFDEQLKYAEANQRPAVSQNMSLEDMTRELNGKSGMLRRYMEEFRDRIVGPSPANKAPGPPEMADLKGLVNQTTRNLDETGELFAEIVRYFIAT